MILVTIADREDTAVLIMIVRIWAFTVLGLILIRLAIALLLKPRADIAALLARVR
jgi:hypothetical protein